MRIVAELSLEPIGSGPSMKNEISEAVKILKQCGLKHWSYRGNGSRQWLKAAIQKADSSNVPL